MIRDKIPQQMRDNFADFGLNQRIPLGLRMRHLLLFSRQAES